MVKYPYDPHNTTVIAGLREIAARSSETTNPNLKCKYNITNLE